jgi:hypothetical protein
MPPAAGGGRSRPTSCSAGHRSFERLGWPSCGFPCRQQVGLVVRSLPARVPPLPVASATARRRDRLPRGRRQRLRASPSLPQASCRSPSPTTIRISEIAGAGRARRPFHHRLSTTGRASSSSPPRGLQRRADLIADASIATRYARIRGWNPLSRRDRRRLRSLAAWLCSSSSRGPGPGGSRSSRAAVVAPDSPIATGHRLLYAIIAKGLILAGS